MERADKVIIVDSNGKKIKNGTLESIGDSIIVDKTNYSVIAKKNNKISVIRTINNQN